eukprot:TRINITY_DN7214_c0_g1_i5.p1 TRINITY_DN7214_c0_g1~~TRINITY_DN7214_c0_g1_i5.p1  ORF type:complete len:164 (+),score=31.35 TRINITY_DN7214_c0_g1_i5:89-580(+)
MIRRPPRSTLSSSSAASDVYKRQADSKGRTPLLLAARAGHASTVAILLLHGSDLAARSNPGWLPEMSLGNSCRGFNASELASQHRHLHTLQVIRGFELGRLVRWRDANSSNLPRRVLRIMVSFMAAVSGQPDSDMPQDLAGDVVLSILEKIAWLCFLAAPCEH